jgi:2-(1,2-epoxy-1,2-dihydrophenyl)acetyl-CoA isomerase
MGAEYFLSRLVGPSLTLELLMTGEVLTGEEALRIGLVNRVVPAARLTEKSMQLAGKIAAMPRLPLRVIKASTYAASRSELKDVLHREAAYQGICYQSEDVREGIAAITEKRPPRFASDD